MMVAMVAMLPLSLSMCLRRLRVGRMRRHQAHAVNEADVVCECPASVASSGASMLRAGSVWRSVCATRGGRRSGADPRAVTRRFEASARRGRRGVHLDRGDGAAAEAAAAAVGAARDERRGLVHRVMRRMRRMHGMMHGRMLLPTVHPTVLTVQ